ncbi:MAG: alpha/beta hydrolase [Rhodospirillaceae bacterium]|jgi:epsilon-lactone hydrolase|nr:alpha/beta hydrolase [Rhodospirillaceae bacterium]MBT7614066.1 alpha/beta hydrolase [Rhodospirillaceae bacterium]
MLSDAMKANLVLLSEGALPAEATWQERREAYDSLSEVFPGLPEVRCEEIDLGGVPGLRYIPPGADESRAIFYMHGGGYCIGSQKSHAMIVTHLAVEAGCPVLFPLYRLSPEHPFPVPAEDCIQAWKAALEQGLDPARTGFAGDSTGGGLVFVVSQAARDRGLALPACVVAISPWTDMEGTGTWRSGDPERDAFLTPGELDMFVEGYLGPDGNRRDVLAAPIHGSFHGLPPFLIQASRTELLYDDAVSLAAALEEAGNAPVLELAGEGTPHVWHHMVPDVPESVASIKSAGAFLTRFTKI